jgi:hypothetical protein
MVIDNFILIKINIPPPILRFERGRGCGGVATSLCDWKTPSPSRISSEGGGGGVVGKHPPSSHVSSEEGWWYGWKASPSVSRFERGRGWCGWKGGVVR